MTEGEREETYRAAATPPPPVAAITSHRVRETKMRAREGEKGRARDRLSCELKDRRKKRELGREERYSQRERFTAQREKLLQHRERERETCTQTEREKERDLQITHSTARERDEMTPA